MTGIGPASATGAGTTVRRWAVRREDHAGRRPGPARTPAAGSSPTAATRSASTAATAAGNRTVVDRPVLVDRTIQAVRWTRRVVRPAGEGDEPAPSITLRRAARLTVAIYRGDTLVRTIWTDKAVTAGTIGWTWNGRTAAGAFVKPGAYRARGRRDEQVRDDPLLARA